MSHLHESQESMHLVERLIALAGRSEARLITAQRQVDALTPSPLARAFLGQLVRQKSDEGLKCMLLDCVWLRTNRTSLHGL